MVEDCLEVYGVHVSGCTLGISCWGFHVGDFMFRGRGSGVDIWVWIVNGFWVELVEFGYDVGSVWLLREALYPSTILRLSFDNPSTMCRT